MLKAFIGKFFKQKETEAVPLTVLKTRSQLVSEGRGSYIPKRHAHGVPTLNKLS